MPGGNTVGQALANVADPVHILIQDADGGVQADDLGVLAAYDEVLHGIERHPLMVIGGYRFKGFDWGPMAGSRTAQLTELANEIDRSVRAAIAKIAPEALYPTEPNLLIKGIDEVHKDGLYDRGIENSFGVAGRGGPDRSQQSACPERRVDRPHPKPILDAPSASTVTSPEPTSRKRGLTVFEDDVPRARSGELYAEVAETRDPARIAANTHPAVAVEMQNQSFANPRTLEREVGIGIGLRDGDRGPDRAGGDLERNVYRQAVHAMRTLSDPHMTPEMERAAMQRHRADLDENTRVLGETRRFRRPQNAEKLQKVKDIVHAIIDAMDGEELKATWSRLKVLFREIEEDNRRGQS